MKCTLCALVILLLSVPVCGALTGKASPAKKEQSHFSAEDEAVHRPVKIPAGVLAILREDHGVKTVMENSSPPLSDPPAGWFSASVLHLGSPGEKDLFV